MKISHRFLTLCFLFSLLAAPQTHAMQPGGGRGWKKPAIITSIVAGVSLLAYGAYSHVRQQQDINLVVEYITTERAYRKSRSVREKMSDQDYQRLGWLKREAPIAWSRLNTTTQQYTYNQVFKKTQTAFCEYSSAWEEHDLIGDLIDLFSVRTDNR